MIIFLLFLVLVVLLFGPVGFWALCRVALRLIGLLFLLGIVLALFVQ